jgi:transcriptional regulator with XRE-family HTH domain
VGVQLKGLESARVVRGLTRQDLARLSGVTYSYLTELESGKRRAGQDAVRRLGAALAAIPAIDGAELLLRGPEGVR